jgi:hypothetical protein
MWTQIARNETSEQALAGGAKARDRCGDVPTGRIGFGRSAAVRHQCQPGLRFFAWRRRFGAAAEVATPALVPVTITPESEEKPARAFSDTIEIEVGGDCRVRVGSSFDGRALKRVLDVLRKR